MCGNGNDVGDGRVTVPGFVRNASMKAGCTMNNVVLWIGVGVICMIFTWGLTGCLSCRCDSRIPSVKNFDASRYLGVWHEIARLPKSYERDLVRVTATYEMDGDTLKITNRGFRDGVEKVSTAVGHFAGPSDEGAFRISFFRPFYGDYRIIWLSPEYDLAMVTGDDRSSLWILARKAEVDRSRLDLLVEQAACWGFDVSRLEYPR